MTKLALNKSTLNRETQRLKAYRQFVPALELKRKQLMAARETARKAEQQLLAQEQQLRQQVADQLAGLASYPAELDALVRIERLVIVHQNLVGLELPQLAELHIQRQAYSCLSTPAWFDLLLTCLEQALRLQIDQRINAQRLRLLQQGLHKTTQRLNLFEKVLIPKTEKNLRKIRIALSDAERAAVVRAKIAKNKRRDMAAI